MMIITSSPCSVLVWSFVYGLLNSVSPVQGAGTLIVGGGAMSSSNDDFWDAIINLSGGPSVARIGLVTAASSDPPDSAQFYIDLFLGRGAEEVYWIPVHEGNLEGNSDPVVVDNINRMSGFFFSGGDQSRIINSFFLEDREPSPALVAIKNVFDGGAAVGGSSAGTACQVLPPMITGGYSWEALLYGAHKIGDPRPNYALEYNPDGGLGLMPEYVLDSHFRERGREGRLVRLLVDTLNSSIGTAYGIGLDENTGLIVHDVGEQDSWAEVVGSGGAFVADISEAQVSDHNGYWRIDSVFAHYLTDGDQMRLRDRQITPDTDKTNIRGNEDLIIAPTSENVFGRNAFHDCATGLFNTIDEDTTWGVSIEKLPEYQVDFFTDDPRAQGYIEPILETISYEYLKLSMYVP